VQRTDDKEEEQHDKRFVITFVGGRGAVQSFRTHAKLFPAAILSSFVSGKVKQRPKELAVDVNDAVNCAARAVRMSKCGDSNTIAQMTCLHCCCCPPATLSLFLLLFI